jgi:hypothetical protein
MTAIKNLQVSGENRLVIFQLVKNNRYFIARPNNQKLSALKDNRRLIDHKAPLTR